MKHQQQDQPVHEFNSIVLSVASPEQILSWSHGEVKKAETINYRTQKPERDGLFCERIFGPTKNWECYCGKYKRIRYKGVICEKCGVEVTRSQVRRERMGHIKLAVPVTHIWFLRSTPSRMGLLLDLPIKVIEQVVYFAAYVITHVDEKAKEEAGAQLTEEFNTHKKKIQGEYQDRISQVKSNKEKLKKTELKKAVDEVQGELATEIDDLTEQHKTAQDDLSSIGICKVLSELEYRDMSMKFGHVFKAGIGAEAIREIISNLDLQKESDRLEAELRRVSGQKQKKLIKRIKFIGSLLKAEIRPEWMVLTVLPVIPPDLRPMVQLDGGRFAASDLNDLYRRVINRNNRLKKLLSIGAPEVICRNEKRMLQEAVDTLLNNSARTGKAVFNAGDKRKLRSLSDMLKGKQGRFRQNLLGKRVDYSGRSVIVVGPKLKLHQCGLPKIMALELFKPFVIGRLIRDGYAHNIKNAEKLIQASRPEVWDILEEVTQNNHVLLNRAPTLHRLGIQAFQPILVEGKAIQIHPLVCAAFNADFDGDQMAVHVPLSRPAQAECANLMLSAKNLLKPSEGNPVVTPTQDMVLGCYYLTKMVEGKKGEGMVFSNMNEAILAYRTDYVHIQAKIKIRLEEKIVETTIGRLIFNSVIPKELGFINRAIDKKSLSKLVGESFNAAGKEKTAELADHLKRMGFKYATQSGLSIAISDMTVPDEKEKILNDASDIVKEVNNQYWKGLVTDDERYNHTIKIWSEAKSSISNLMMNSFGEENDIRYMIDSGARGNWGQITQMCGMKGLVANPAGRTIELPIKSNLKEGFTILEYFIATHGGRKGKSDTALKTAEAGYLTRRLVDAMQDIIIKEVDCKTPTSHTVHAAESEAVGVPFADGIFGRILAEDITHPKTKAVLAKAGEEVDEENIDTIIEAGVEVAHVRSVITCLTENGICQHCYGRDLSTNNIVEVGTAVGIIAAQSIGEPGTQLTMRTFHMGGVAEGQDITQGLTRVEEVFEARPPKSPALLAEVTGSIKVSRKGKHIDIHLLSDEPVEETYELDADLSPDVKKGDKIKEKQVIARAKDSKKTLKSTMNGVVTEAKDGIIKIKSIGKVEHVYNVPGGKTLKVANGDSVQKGDALTSGHINLRDLMALTDVYTAQKYIIGQVQTIYTSQGQSIHDKHIEIIARQMLSKIRVIEPGGTNLLPGQISNIIQWENINKAIKSKVPSRSERLLLGLTRIALYTDSWLSAASFQETIRVLVEASTTKTVDHLDGLKENVIIGKLIPAGETYRKRNPEAMK